MCERTHAKFHISILQRSPQVRGGDWKGNDLLWREFLSLGLTDSANKSQYVPYAVHQIFWSTVLKPPLAELFHNLRSLPVSQRPGAQTGWDHPCEGLNGAITACVTSHLSQERIARFVAQYPFLDVCYHEIVGFAHADRSADPDYHGKDPGEAVQRLKAHFIDRIGRTWAIASRSNASSKLRMESVAKPWLEIRKTMTRAGDHSLAAIVRRHSAVWAEKFYAFDE